MSALRSGSRQIFKTLARAQLSTRKIVASSRVSNAAETLKPVSPLSLGQLSQRRPTEEAPALQETSTSETAPVKATKEEETFTIPSCLLPSSSLPPTHNHHVATLHLRSYTDSVQNLDLFCEFARKSAFSLGIPCSGVAYLPTRTSLWTVPRSPFVHKKSQENFWRKTHKRAIKVWDANEEVVDKWLQFLRIHAMPGVGQKAELFRWHQVGVGEKLMDEANKLRREVKEEETTDENKVKAIADEFVDKEMKQGTEKTEQ